MVTRGRIESKSAENDIYGEDHLLMAQDEMLQALLTDDVFNKVRRKRIEAGKPFISPDYYFPVFVLGMSRLKKTTPEFAILQCQRAVDPNNLLLAATIADDLAFEYQNKLAALGKIAQRKVTALELPEVDLEMLARVGQVVRNEMGQKDIDYIRGAKDTREQRARLRSFVAKAHSEILPLILEVSEPVMKAGEQVLEETFKMLGINRATLVSGVMAKQKGVGFLG